MQPALTHRAYETTLTMLGTRARNCQYLHTNFAHVYQYAVQSVAYEMGRGFASFAHSVNIFALL